MQEKYFILNFSYLNGSNHEVTVEGFNAEEKWRGVDLNHRPVGYEPNALSAELPRQNCA
jgi:hypothetical protein